MAQRLIASASRHFEGLSIWEAAQFKACPKFADTGMVLFSFRVATTDCRVTFSSFHVQWWTMMLQSLPPVDAMGKRVVNHNLFFLIYIKQGQN